MKHSIIDDHSSNNTVIFTKRKIIAYLIILIGLFYLYNALSGWYHYYYPSAFVFVTPPEIYYPIELLAGILVSYLGIQLLLNQLGIKATLIASAFIGILEAVIFIWII